MNTLNTTCYTVQDGQIVEGTLADFTHFIETTTRPTGVGYKYYATTVTRMIERATDKLDENGYTIYEEVEADVWVLAKWATWGGPQVVVSEHESEEEAEDAAEQTYVYDILNNSEFVIWLDRVEAERELAESAE